MHYTKQAAAEALAFDNAITRAVLHYRRQADHGPDLAGPFIRHHVHRWMTTNTTHELAIRRACRDFEARHVVRRGAWMETGAATAA